MGDWSLVEMDFQVGFPENEIRIITNGKDLTAPIQIYMDNLMIREKGTTFFENGINFQGEFYIRKNNHIQKDFYYDFEF